MRLLCILVVLCSFLFCGFIVVVSNRRIAQAESKIYIMACGQAMDAFAADRDKNIEVEARAHVEMFHQLFFSLEPDEHVIDEHIGNALYLIDGSGKRLYENLKEQGYYAGIVSGNISQQVTVDSVVLDMAPYPFRFRCFATQRLIRTTSIVTRDLITEGQLRTVVRSDHNKHGFLIERLNIVENKDKKIENR